MSDMPMPFRIRVSSRHEVPRLAASFAPTHLVSVVVGKPATVAAILATNVLHLRMDDILVSGLTLSPSREHVRRLLRFTGGLSADDRILFHCEAGISRSSAAAWIALVGRMGLDGAEEAARWVHELRPEADPNRLLVRLAAKEFGDRQGRLEAALPIFDGWKLVFDEEDSFGTIDETGREPCGASVGAGSLDPAL